MTDAPINIVIVDGSAVSKSSVRDYERTRNRIRVTALSTIQSGNYSDTFGFDFRGVGYDIDTTDTTSADDGLNVIVDVVGTRFKRVVFNVTSPPQGRLTLTTGVPVMITDVAAATTIFYTPAVGRSVPLYTGTAFVDTDMGGELSNITTNSSTGKAGPAAVTTNKNYDLFVWNDAGTIRLTRGPPWTSDTARGTGAATTELVLVNGIYLNAVAITNGPAAQRGTFVGSVRSDGSSQINMKFGTLASGGGMATLGVSNAYNEVLTQAHVRDSTANWTYSSATYRNVNASASNRVNFLSCLAQNAISATYTEGQVNLVNAVLANVAVGFSLDSTTPDYAVVYFSSSGIAGSASVHGTLTPQLGFHFVQAVEKSDGTNSNQFIGNGAQHLNLLTMM